MTLAAGQTLSHYEILGPLGAGAMGEVYRARDTRLEREVALRVLPEELVGDEERLMLLNGGELDGTRLLGRKTVELMTTKHLPPGMETRGHHLGDHRSQRGVGVTHFRSAHAPRR